MILDYYINISNIYQKGKKSKIWKKNNLIIKKILQSQMKCNRIRQEKKFLKMKMQQINLRKIKKLNLLIYNEKWMKNILL